MACFMGNCSLYRDALARRELQLFHLDVCREDAQRECFCRDFLVCRWPHAWWCGGGGGPCHDIPHSHCVEAFAIASRTAGSIRLPLMMVYVPLQLISGRSPSDS